MNRHDSYVDAQTLQLQNALKSAREMAKALETVVSGALHQIQDLEEVMAMGPSPPSEIPPPYTLGEFLALPDVPSKGTLYKMWKSGTGPPHEQARKGTKVFLPRQESDDWLKAYRRIKNGPS